MSHRYASGVMPLRTGTSADAPSPFHATPPEKTVGSHKKIKWGSPAVFREIVLLPQGFLPLGRLGGEKRLPPGAEVDVPAPETSQRRGGLFVVMGAELAAFA